MCEIWITDFQKALTHKLGGRLRAKKKKNQINMRQILSPLTSKWLTFANFSSFKVFQGFIISTYLLTIKGLQKKKKKDPLVVAVHHHLLPSVMSSLAC